jgi:NTE family protein
MDSHDAIEQQSAANLAVVLAGGGARGAYQAGVLRGIGRHLPHLRLPVLVGVSAGAINTAFLAAHSAPLGAASDALVEVWRGLETDDIFRVDMPSLVKHFSRWVARLASGGGAISPEVRGLVDSSPLQSVIERAVPTVDGEFVGIADNLAHGRLKAAAITTFNYSTGQTITWVQGAEIVPWRRPRHRAFKARLTVEHVMASAALPIFFPAVRLGDAWHGDGGVRLDAPLSAAVRLGARRILAISPRYEPTEEEADRHKISGYPPPAQIISQLMNAIFLDVIDRDARILALVNELLKEVPPQRRRLEPVDILVLRTSQDLGRLAARYEKSLPKTFRHLTRGLGSRETTTPDFLSFLMFEPDYLRELLDIGERDAEARIDEIRRFLAGAPSDAQDSAPAA